MKREIEIRNSTDAKRLVDMVFEAKLFHPDLTRDGLMAIEDMIAFYLQSNEDSYRRLYDLTQQVEKLKKQPLEKAD